MRIENSYTLNEYKEKYPFLLEKFLLEYEDHDEVMFATAEIKEFYAGLIDIPAIEASNEYVKLLHENIQIELDKNGDLDFLESELAQRAWFASAQFSAADIQMSFPLEAAAARGGLDQRYPNLTDFLARIHARPAYQRALAQGGEFNLG